MQKTQSNLESEKGDEIVRRKRGGGQPERKKVANHEEEKREKSASQPLVLVGGYPGGRISSAFNLVAEHSNTQYVGGEQTEREGRGDIG